MPDHHLAPVQLGDCNWKRRALVVGGVEEVKIGLQVDTEGSNHWLNVDVSDSMTSLCVSVDMCDSLFEFVIAHDSLAVGVEFTTFQEWWQSLEGVLNAVLVRNGCVSIHANFDVITCFGDDDSWDVKVVPIVVSLFGKILEAKVKRGWVITMHWMVAESVASPKAQKRVVFVRHFADGAHWIEKAQTRL